MFSQEKNKQNKAKNDKADFLSNHTEHTQTM